MILPSSLQFIKPVQGLRSAWLRRGLGLLLPLLLLLVVPQAVRADGGDTIIDCDIPLSVVCTVTDPDGISLVQVEIATGLGDILVVDEAFSCETEVQVSWDPIVPGYEFFVTDCDTAPSPTPPGMQIVYGGASHLATGAATLALSDQHLVVGNIGTTGRDGALVNLRPYSFWEGHFKGLDLRNTSDIGFLEMALTGQVEGGGVQPLLAMKVQAQGDQLALSVDNGPLNASLNTVRVFNGETLVKETIVTGGLLVIQLENDAKWCNPFVGCKFEFWKRKKQVAESLSFSEAITLDLNGEKVVGDRIEITPGDDILPVDAFQELNLSAAALGELVFDQVQTTMPPLTFAGLSHAARRSTIAELERESLVLTDFNPDGQSGVSVDLGRAGAWEAHTYLKPENKAMTLLSVLGEAAGERQRFSTLTMQGDDDTFALSATFGSPTYRMIVYDGGNVVHQELDLNNGQRGVQFSGNDPICEAIGVDLSVALGICEYVWGFGQNASGECFWELEIPAGARFETPDGQVSGNRIVITENHETHHHHHHRSEPAQMIFDEMRIQAAQVEEITILDEMVAPIETPYSLFLPLLSR